MESLQEIAKRQQAVRPNYYDDPQKDQMLALILELTEELCVLQDQIDNCTQLSAAGKPNNPAALKAFKPSSEEMERRLAQHTQRFEQVLSRIKLR
jgi:hypothetical protein